MPGYPRLQCLWSMFFFWCMLHKECQYQDVTYINIRCRWAWICLNDFEKKTTWLNSTLSRQLWLFQPFPKRASSRRPACMGPPFHVTYIFLLRIDAFSFHGSQRSSCWDPGRWLWRQKSKITISMIYVLSFDVYCIKSANIKMLHISTSLVAELECFSKKQPGLTSLYAGSCGYSACFRREQAAGGQLAWARLSMLHLWYVFMFSTFMVLSVPHVEIREGDCQGRSPRLQCLWSMFFLFDVYCIKSANIKMLHISTSLVAELECFSKKQPGLTSLYAGSCGYSACFRREQAAGGQLAWARLSMLRLFDVTYWCFQLSWFSAFLMLRSWKVIVKAEVQDYNFYDLCSFFWCILHKECQYQDVTYINIACRWAWMLFKKQPGLSSLYAGSCGSSPCFRREQAAGGQLAWARLSMLHLLNVMYWCFQFSWFSAFLMLRSWKVIVKAEVQDCNVYDLCSFFLMYTA